jgi:integrase
MFCTVDLSRRGIDLEGVTVGASVPLRAAQLSLWRPDEDEPASSVSPEDWTLRDFLDDWFRPNYLEVKGRGAYNDYAAAVEWWEAVTANPRLASVTQTAAGAAVKGLRVAVSPRTKKPLAGRYQVKVITHWRVLFAHAGPRFGRKGAYAGLLAEAPWFDLPACKRAPKATWDYAEARRIAAAAGGMVRPVLPGVCSAGDWWRLLLATLYYFGLRDGQAIGLRLGQLRAARDGWTLEVDSVEKTGKQLVRRCPDQWLAAVQAVHGPGPWIDDAPLLPWPLASRGKSRALSESTKASQLVRWHGSPAMSRRARKLARPQQTLQDLAGLPLDRHFELHAWRRLHVRLRTESGAAEAIAAGIGAAQHTDAAVTRNHYYDGDEGTPLVIAARFPLF